MILMKCDITELMLFISVPGITNIVPITLSAISMFLLHMAVIVSVNSNVDL